MLQFLKRHKDLLFFGLFLILTTFYFVSQQYAGPRHMIHAPLDDKIPFLPGFIVPYCVWFVYIPALMLYMCFTDPRRFRRQVLTLFSGAYFCGLIFLLYPSAIDFRPTPQGRDLFSALCRLIYASDRPVNVFPSLHCYEALAIHLSTFHGDFGRRHPVLRAGSLVLVIAICLSTVFVKQHSVLDLIAGVCLALVVHFLVCLFYRKRASHDSKAL